jgi:hypothetical protein
MSDTAGPEALAAIDRLWADQPDKVGHDFSLACAISPPGVTPWCGIGGSSRQSKTVVLSSGSTPG